MEFNHYYFINKPTPSLRKKEKIRNKLQNKYNWSAIFATIGVIIVILIMIMLQIKPSMI